MLIAELDIAAQGAFDVVQPVGLDIAEQVAYTCLCLVQVKVSSLLTMGFV